PQHNLQYLRSLGTPFLLPASISSWFTPHLNSTTLFRTFPHVMSRYFSLRSFPFSSLYVVSRCFLSIALLQSVSTFSLTLLTTTCFHASLGPSYPSCQN